MIKWKGSGKKKKKPKEIDIEVTSDDEEEKEEEKQEETVEEDEEKPLAEYKETLYSTDSPKSVKPKKTGRTDTKQSVWRNVKSIEEDVDHIHIKKAQKPVTAVDKKVDKLIEKTKEKHSKRKASNVIYVVSKPQPGQVKGDWAVRSHGKIYSHHRTKDNAIKAARKIAIEKEATVMVQNTDGTFSDGFKPRPKK
jgi:hypothetical protein